MKNFFFSVLIYSVLLNNLYAQRIVNGNDANITDFPWQIALESKSGMGMTWDQCCGGAIIDESWVLTAAHCVWSMDSITSASTDYRIRAGIELLSSTGGQTINVDTYYIHPQFDMMTTNQDYDIALLHLESPLLIDNVFTKIIQIVSPQDSIDGLTDPGLTGFLSGWGRIDTAGNITTDRLQYLDAEIYSLANANNASMWNGQLESMHLPVMPDVGGVCYGDSGGPYVVYNQDSSDYILAGLMSFIYPTFCGDTNYADVLSRVSYYYDWIYSVINSQSLIPMNPDINFHIYPNPSNSIIEVEMAEIINEIQVLNTFGQTLLKVENTKEIDISGLDSGVYIIIISGDNFKLNERIIVY